MNKDVKEIKLLVKSLSLANKGLWQFHPKAIPESKSLLTTRRELLRPPWGNPPWSPSQLPPWRTPNKGNLSRESWHEHIHCPGQGQGRNSTDASVLSLTRGIWLYTPRPVPYLRVDTAAILCSLHHHTARDVVKHKLQDHEELTSNLTEVTFLNHLKGGINITQRSVEQWHDTSSRCII